MNIKNKKLKKLRVIFDNLALSHLNDKNFIFTRKGGKLYSLDKNENHTSQKYEWATYMGNSYFVKLPKSDKIIVCNHVEVNMCFYMRNWYDLENSFHKFVAPKPNDFKEPHMCIGYYDGIDEAIKWTKEDIKYSIKEYGYAERYQYEALETYKTAKIKFKEG